MRPLLLIIEWTFSFITLELAIIFIIKYLRHKDKIKDLRDLGYASLFIGYSLFWYWFIISDYYVSEQVISPFFIWKQGSERYVFLNLSYVSLMVGALFFIYIMEKYRVYLFRKNFFTYCFLFLISIFMISFLIDIELTQDISILFWPLYVLFLILYIVDFVKIKQNREKILKGVAKYLSPFLLLAGSFVMTTDFAIEFVGSFGIRLAGSIIQLISMIIVYYFFSTLPSFHEFEWRDKIEELYLIDRAGVCLYNKSFIDKIEFDEEHLISSALASINIILQELTQNNKMGLSVIKKEEKIITIFTSEYSSAIIFSSKELEYIGEALKKFIKNFEAIYKNVLINWDGDTDIFTPVESLIDDIFLEK
jgi:hypothetical protein